MRGTNAIDLGVSAPIRLSVTEALLEPRYQNNVNDRGPAIYVLGRQQYLCATVAAAGVRLSFEWPHSRQSVTEIRQIPVILMPQS